MTAVSWKKPVDGSFTTATNWSTGTVPGASSAVTLGFPDFYTVSLTSGLTISSLSITGPSAVLDIEAPGKTVTITNNVIDDGQINVGVTGTGGGIVNIGGTLTVTNSIIIGNSAITQNTTVTAAALNNSDNIQLVGGTAQATLHITGAATGSFIGFLFLDGNTLLQFGSGHITTITTDAQIVLDGAMARIASGSSTATNSGLSLLANNAGFFDVEDGAVVKTTTHLNNTGDLEVDTDSGGGGSRVLIGGLLNNSGFFGIGNDQLTAATQMTVGGLTNTGEVDITGLGARATLYVNVAAPTSLSGAFDLDGNALLEFASGGITSIAEDGNLSLDGRQSVVALAGQTATSSALAGLATIDGQLVLQDGAALSVTGNLTNNGFFSIETNSTLSVAGSLTNKSNVSSFGDGSKLTIGASLVNNQQFSLSGNGAGMTVIGTLSNSSTANSRAFMSFGSGDSTGPFTVTAAKLSNTGELDLSGGTGLTSVIIGATAPTSIGAEFDLNGDALLQFTGGGITSITSAGSLRLDGANARIAVRSTPASNSALTGLKSNAGSLSIDEGAKVATTVNFTNTASLTLSGGLLTIGGSLTNSGNLSVQGTGSSLTVNGGLTNTGTLSIVGDSAKVTVTGALTVNSSDFQPLTIGNGTNSGPITVTVGSLVTSDLVSLDGGPGLATLNVGSAAPATLNNDVSVTGNALLEFARGGIATIASGTSLQITGAGARVAIAGKTGTSSALTTLANVAGLLAVDDGATVTTTGNLTDGGSIDLSGGTLNIGGSLTNTQSLSVDDGTIFSTNTVLGGSLTVGGTLTNGAAGGFNTMFIGSNSITKAVTVTAAALVNNTTIDITGGTALATLDLTSAAPATLSGNFDLSGNALLEFASGGITTIAGSLILDGPHARIGLVGKTGSSTALTGLATNSGSLSLENGAVLTINAGFTNNGFIDISGGSTLTLNAGSSTTDTFDVSGATLKLGSTFTISGGFTLQSGATLSGGTLSGTGFIDVFSSTLSGVTIGSGTIVHVSSGTAADVTLNHVTVAGTLSGNGASALAFALAGTDSMTNVNGFSTVNLANGTNTLALTVANFTGLFGSTITVNGGTGNDALNAGGVTLSNFTSVLDGGAGIDTLTAGLQTTMSGGAGADLFVLTTPGSPANPAANTIIDFVHATDKLVFRDAGFNLGSQEGTGTSTPKAIAASLFSSHTDGTFATTANRFAYNKSTGQFFYDADGSGNGSASQLVATFSNKAGLTASDVFFVA